MSSSDSEQTTSHVDRPLTQAGYAPTNNCISDTGCPVLQETNSSHTVANTGLLAGESHIFSDDDECQTDSDITLNYLSYHSRSTLSRMNSPNYVPDEEKVLLLERMFLLKRNHVEMSQSFRTPELWLPFELELREIPDFALEFSVRYETIRKLRHVYEMRYCGRLICEFSVDLGDYEPNTEVYSLRGFLSSLPLDHDIFGKYDIRSRAVCEDNQTLWEWFWILNLKPSIMIDQDPSTSIPVPWEEENDNSKRKKDDPREMGKDSNQIFAKSNKREALFYYGQVSSNSVEEESADSTVQVPLLTYPVEQEPTYFVGEINQEEVTVEGTREAGMPERGSLIGANQLTAVQKAVTYPLSPESEMYEKTRNDVEDELTKARKTVPDRVFLETEMFERFNDVAGNGLVENQDAVTYQVSHDDGMSEKASDLDEDTLIQNQNNSNVGTISVETMGAMIKKLHASMDRSKACYRAKMLYRGSGIGEHELMQNQDNSSVCSALYRDMDEARTNEVIAELRAHMNLPERTDVLLQEQGGESMFPIGEDPNAQEALIDQASREAEMSDGTKDIDENGAMLNDDSSTLYEEIVEANKDGITIEFRSHMEIEPTIFNTSWMMIPIREDPNVQEALTNQASRETGIPDSTCDFDENGAMLYDDLSSFYKEIIESTLDGIMMEFRAHFFLPDRLHSLFPVEGGPDEPNPIASGWIMFPVKVEPNSEYPPARHHDFLSLHRDTLQAMKAGILSTIRAQMALPETTDGLFPGKRRNDQPILCTTGWCVPNQVPHGAEIPDRTRDIDGRGSLQNPDLSSSHCDITGARRAGLGHELRSPLNLPESTEVLDLEQRGNNQPNPHTIGGSMFPIGEDPNVQEALIDQASREAEMSDGTKDIDENGAILNDDSSTLYEEIVEANKDGITIEFRSHMEIEPTIFNTSWMMIPIREDSNAQEALTDQASCEDEIPDITCDFDENGVMLYGELSLFYREIIESTLDGLTMEFRAHFFLPDRLHSLFPVEGGPDEPNPIASGWIMFPVKVDPNSEYPPARHHDFSSLHRDTLQAMEAGILSTIRTQMALPETTDGLFPGKRRNDQPILCTTGWCVPNQVPHGAEIPDRTRDIDGRGSLQNPDLSSSHCDITGARRAGLGHELRSPLNLPESTEVLDLEQRGNNQPNPHTIEGSMFPIGEDPNVQEALIDQASREAEMSDGTKDIDENGAMLNDDSSTLYEEIVEANKDGITIEFRSHMEIEPTIFNTSWMMIPIREDSNAQEALTDQASCEDEIPDITCDFDENGVMLYGELSLFYREIIESTLDGLTMEFRAHFFLPDRLHSLFPVEGGPDEPNPIASGWIMFPVKVDPNSEYPPARHHDFSSLHRDTLQAMEAGILSTIRAQMALPETTDGLFPGKRRNDQPILCTTGWCVPNQVPHGAEIPDRTRDIDGRGSLQNPDLSSSHCDITGARRAGLGPELRSPLNLPESTEVLDLEQRGNNQPNPHTIGGSMFPIGEDPNVQEALIDQASREAEMSDGTKDIDENGAILNDDSSTLYEEIVEANKDGITIEFRSHMEIEPTIFNTSWMMIPIREDPNVQEALTNQASRETGIPDSTCDFDENGAMLYDDLLSFYKEIIESTLDGIMMEFRAHFFLPDRLHSLFPVEGGPDEPNPIASGWIMFPVKVDPNSEYPPARHHDFSSLHRDTLQAMEAGILSTIRAQMALPETTDGLFPGKRRNDQPILCTTGWCVPNQVSHEAEIPDRTSDICENGSPQNPGAEILLQRGAHMISPERPELVPKQEENDEHLPRDMSECKTIE